jgi:hypothetical protein
MKKISGILCMAFLIFGMALNAYALSVLGTTQIYSNYGYNGPGWTNMTAALDTATANNFDTVANFENLSVMMTYDALWLDLRGVTTLTPTEYSNIQAFIATGKRVVMFGENNNWTAWNQQILGMNGGTYAGDTASVSATRLVINELTNNAPEFSSVAGGIATGGTALYDPNFATLWGDNVLTILDVNLFSDANWVAPNYAAFATNVANWIAASESAPLAQSIPTLNEWGMIIFMVLAGIAAAFYLNKGNMSV